MEAEELLAAIAGHVKRCPLGWNNGVINRTRSTTDADIIEWLCRLENLTLTPVEPAKSAEPTEPGENKITLTPFGPPIAENKIAAALLLRDLSTKLRIRLERPGERLDMKPTLHLEMLLPIADDKTPSNWTSISSTGMDQGWV